MSEVVLLSVDGVPYKTLPRLLLLDRSIFAGRYATTAAPTDDDRKVRRVLDIGAGCGAFALYAAAQWEGCWVDAWEPDPEARALLEENGPAGMRVLRTMPTEWAPYQVVRIADEDAHRQAMHPDPSYLPGVPMLIVDYQKRGCLELA